MTAALLIFFQGGMWELLSSTQPVARIVLAILVFLSIYSWAIILKKRGNLKTARKESAAFLKVFRQGRKLSEIRAACRGLRSSPLAEVFLSGYREIENQVYVSDNPGTPRIKSLPSVQRAMQIASSEQLTRLERLLSSLATIGAVSPFIGLFGTVWGIIDAFTGLGSAGTATLRSVAPGISEALVTTAAGLFAAIPAVMAYNHYLQRAKELGVMMDDFALEFLNLTERYFT